MELKKVEKSGGYIMDDKCVVLNAKKMNFDGKLDFSILSSDVTVYDDTTEQQLQFITMRCVDR